VYVVVDTKQNKQTNKQTDKNIFVETHTHTHTHTKHVDKRRASGDIDVLFKYERGIVSTILCVCVCACVRACAVDRGLKMAICIPRMY